MSSSAHSSDDEEEYVPTIERVKMNHNSAITRMNDPLNDTNWIIWHERMSLLCEVEGYAKGEIEKPNAKDDPEGAANWTINDTYARVLISSNVTSSEMIHISGSKTAHMSWSNLEAVHDCKGHQTTIACTQNLYHTVAREGDNIPEHLTKLKQYWERINLMGDNDFKISDIQFKVIISASLPPSWDTFVESYVGRRRGMKEIDPKKLMGSQEFIGVIKEEYIRQKARNEEWVYQAMNANKPLLAERIDASTSSMKYCQRCKKKNHSTQECRSKNSEQCTICKKHGHATRDCWHRKPYDKPDKDEKGKRKEEANMGEDVEELIAF